MRVNRKDQLASCAIRNSILSSMIYYKKQKFKAKKLKLDFVFQNPMDQFIAKTVHDEIYLTIMDEPTYRQDEELTIKIMNQLREVVEKEGRSFS